MLVKILDVVRLGVVGARQVILAVVQSEKEGIFRLAQRPAVSRIASRTG
jgi:hypothetical protein